MFAFSIQTVIDSKEEIIRNLEEQNSKLQQSLMTLQMQDANKVSEIKSLTQENADLKASLTRTKKYLKEAEEDKQRGGACEADQEQLRKAKRELEENMKKLEEELEEITSHNQQLTQTVTRLEMAASKVKNEKKREVENREAEIAEIRSSHQRQYRALEEEIDALTKANHNLMVKNRQLESQGRQLQNRQQRYVLVKIYLIYKSHL